MRQAHGVKAAAVPLQVHHKSGKDQGAARLRHQDHSRRANSTIAIEDSGIHMKPENASLTSSILSKLTDFGTPANLTDEVAVLKHNSMACTCHGEVQESRRREAVAMGGNPISPKQLLK